MSKLKNLIIYVLSALLALETGMVIGAGVASMDDVPDKEDLFK